MALEARRWLDLLDEHQRTCARFESPDDEERTRWFYTPTEHGGLRLVECNPDQRQAALRLLATALSPAGYDMVAAVMGHELVLERLEGWPMAAWGRVRDPLGYALSVFGEPESDAWAWRFAGHHLSLHYTIVDGALASTTPSFIGLDPAEVPLPGDHLLRPCSIMGDLAFELLGSLDADQRATAIVAVQAPPDIVTGNRAALTEGLWVTPARDLFRDAEQFPGAPFIDLLEARHRADEDALEPATIAALRWSRSPTGLSSHTMRPAQRDALSKLIDVYLERLPDDAAQAQRATLTDDPSGDLHFAWAGSIEPRRPHYYRVQGPRVLLEYDNSQRDANHIHTVWRDRVADFGVDALAAHYATEH
jgi:hypothetical protein